MKLTGFRCWVIGGSAGIGRQCAQDLLKAGATVVISARSGPRLEEANTALAAAYPGAVHSVPVDVTRTDQVTSATDAAFAALGGLDGVVVGGGAPRAGSILELSDGDWEAGIRLKLLGQIRITRAVLPRLLAQRSGRIVHVVGVHSVYPNPHAIAAGVVNAGLLNFVKAVAAEAAPSGVLINAINPYLVRTERFRHLAEHRALREEKSLEEVMAAMEHELPVGHVCDPEEVSSLILWLLSESARGCSGSIFTLDGGRIPTL